jgi:hypothetical protein
MIIALAVIIMTPATIIPSLIMTVIPMIRMLFPISWSVFTVVPIVLYKVDSLVACVVLTTVLSPVFTMPRWYTQIYRFAFNLYAFNYSWLSIDYSWLWIAANIESTIKAWLSDTDRNPNVGSEHRGSDCDSSNCCCS